jgi:hypothetical protein
MKASVPGCALIRQVTGHFFRELFSRAVKFRKKAGFSP